MTESWLGAPKQRTATVGCGGVRVRACVRPCMRACVHDVFAIYDNIILSRLIMIIIKIIILYFIQIRHTDDFPSAGIPASSNKNLMFYGKIYIISIYDNDNMIMIIHST